MNNHDRAGLLSGLTSLTLIIIAIGAIINVQRTGNRIAVLEARVAELSARLDLRTP